MQSSTTDGSAWVNDGSSRRVLRGGSWFDNAYDCRVADRSYNDPTCSSDYNGFRVCWDAK